MLKIVRCDDDSCLVTLARSDKDMEGTPSEVFAELINDAAIPNIIAATIESKPKE